jgi:uncharacterized RDD family membrane protein YckC
MESILDYQRFERVEYAGFMARFAAAVVDGLIVFAIVIGLMTVFVCWIGPDTAQANGLILRAFYDVVFIIISWIYCAMLESGPKQSTIGKRLLGMKVTDLDGKQISFARASARHFGKILSQLILFMGYVMMLFSPNGQCLHDSLSGCLVMRKGLA